MLKAKEYSLKAKIPLMPILYFAPAKETQMRSGTLILIVVCTKEAITV